MIKVQNSKPAASHLGDSKDCFEHLSFEIVSDFEIRISDFLP